MSPPETSSPAFRIHLSSSEGLPIYLQITNGIKYLVASGRMSPGDELPAIRALAERLVVNPNTIARAYRELEIAGVVEKRRTAGTYIAEGNSVLAEKERIRVLTERIDGLLVEARQLNISTELVLTLIQARDARLSERNETEVNS